MEQYPAAIVLCFMTKALLLLIVSQYAFAAGISGQWNLQIVQFGEESAPARVEFKADGTKLTGTLNELKLEGTIEGDRVQITAMRPDGKEWGKFDGRMQGDGITGTVRRGKDEFAWKAQRAGVASASPKMHVFEPTQFHRVFSGAIAPALRIYPGDTIKTSTVDAGGRDSKSVARSMGGNPLTGPFYIEGAMPGDTLSVKFHRIRLNRDSASSGDRIVPSAVTPRYYRDAKFDEKFNSEWKLDREVADFQSFDVGLYPIDRSLYAEEWAAGKSGFKAIQYMAVGIPFVAAPVGAMADIGEAGVTHFAASSHDEWYRRLASLLADVQLRQTMGAAGRRHVVDHYSLADQADKLASALKEAVGMRKAD